LYFINDNVFVVLGAMIILLLLFAVLHNGLANSSYALFEKHLLNQLGKIVHTNTTVIGEMKHSDLID